MNGIGEIIRQNAAKRGVAVQRFSVWVEIPADETVDVVENEIISNLESCGYEIRVKRDNLRP